MIINISKSVSGYGGEQGIRTLEAVLAAYTISNRAPSTSSDNSPRQQFNIIYDTFDKIKYFFAFSFLIKFNRHKYGQLPCFYLDSISIDCYNYVSF